MYLFLKFRALFGPVEITGTIPSELSLLHQLTQLNFMDLVNRIFYFTENRL